MVHCGNVWHRCVAGRFRVDTGCANCRVSCAKSVWSCNIACSWSVSLLSCVCLSVDRKSQESLPYYLRCLLFGRSVHYLRRQRSSAPLSVLQTRRAMHLGQEPPIKAEQSVTASDAISLRCHPVPCGVMVRNAIQEVLTRTVGLQILEAFDRADRFLYTPAPTVTTREK